jgi:hypothetical protein
VAQPRIVKGEGYHFTEAVPELSDARTEPIFVQNKSYSQLGVSPSGGMV